MNGIIGAAAVVLTIVTAAAAAPVEAVQNGRSDAGEAEVRTEVRAQELKAQAEALFTQPRQWRKAARLLEQSAALRDASDREAYTCLIYAGRIRAALGDAQGARATLEKAGDHALARGALLEAAHAYIDAAHAAVEGRQPAQAQQLVERARLLAASPYLTAQQQSFLKIRLPA